MQSLEHAVKLTTTSSGQIAGAKTQILEILCTIVKKKEMGRKKILRYKQSCSCQSKKPKLSLLFALH